MRNISMTAMKICVWNIKGGQGKTLIAMNLAKMLDCCFLTNELISPLENNFEEGEFLQLRSDQPVPDLPTDFPCVFDFGGALDKRVIKALKESDWTIVPVLNEYMDLYVAITTIYEIQKFTSRIIICANRIVQSKAKGKDDFEEIKSHINDKFPKYPVFPIKESRAMPNIILENKSISEMVLEGGYKRFHFTTINDQFISLLDYMKTNRKGV